MIERRSDIFTLSVSQMTEQLADVYVSLTQNGVPFRKFPSVMLWGSPGVGKSQGVRQIAKELEERTGKTVLITDVRLLLFNPVDLRGIPTANAEKTLAVWLKPKIFQMDESDNVINILFLDEISAAPMSVQAAAYQITLDRTVGEHTLPENCIVIAAGNSVTDKSVAYNMPKALANRLCHMEIFCDHAGWREWAIKSGIHEIVLGFLDYYPDLLAEPMEKVKSNAFPTPRSWEMVSNILSYVSPRVADVYPMIIGCIGVSAAYQLREWSEVYQNIPPVEAIFAGTHTGVPARPMMLFALSAQILSYIRKHHSKQEVTNVIKYTTRFPGEFRNRMFWDLLQIKAIRPALRGNDVFCEWFSKTNRHWSDYGV